ncbi:helix-turn-helix domain-containing protein [Rhizobium herbae]
MTTNQLKQLRELTPFSQAGFAKEMGVPLRTYEDLESGRTQVRAVHVNAAIWAVVKAAANEPVFTTTTLPDGVADILKAALRKEPTA